MQNSENRTSKTKDIDFLNQNLQQFGLCPTDWTLKKESAQKYLITHKDDPDFFFIGKIKDETQNWDFIQLGFI